jgi:hypothetical protein
VRKEGEVLKNVPELSALHWKVPAARVVEENPVANLDLP